jgi:hypothetical protein
MGPVYINLDAEMQEAKLSEPLAPIDAALHAASQSNGVAELIQQAADAQGSQAPGHPDGAGVAQRGRLERAHRACGNLNAKVISDLKIGCASDRPSAPRRRSGIERDGAGSDRSAQSSGRSWRRLG